MNEHTRKNSIRLPGYDYSKPGVYFITICACKGEPMFGNIANGEMCLNDYGRVANEELRKTSAMWHFNLDCHVVMPNHSHFIAIVPEQQVKSNNQREKQFIPTMVQAYKASVTRAIGFSLWHRSYHDTIIKDQEMLERVRAYIRNNPTNWESDRFHPKNDREFMHG